MTQHFTSTGYLPTGTLTNRAGEAFQFAALPAFLRVLLSTDGTVTKSLESYFWEPVRVENLGQGYSVLAQDEPVVACAAGARVLRRRVQLVGQHSGHTYALADSLVRDDLLPASVRQDLAAGLVGIGELLRECSLETYREIMDFGYGSAGDADTVWRCYRIVMGGTPFIQITEHFPISLYR